MVAFFPLSGCEIKAEVCGHPALNHVLDQLNQNLWAGPWEIGSLTKSKVHNDFFFFYFFFFQFD